jgi:hypothetical protein
MSAVTVLLRSDVLNPPSLKVAAIAVVLVCIVANTWIVAVEIETLAASLINQIVGTRREFVELPPLVFRGIARVRIEPVRAWARVKTLA